MKKGDRHRLDGVPASPAYSFSAAGARLLPRLPTRKVCTPGIHEEFTEVVNVSRNVTTRLPIERREMLLRSARDLCLPLQHYLGPELLRRIVGG